MQAIYEQVVQLVEQLSVEERQRLVAHIQDMSEPRVLNPSEWEALVDAITVTLPLGADFSSDRSDWYDDER